MYTIGEYQREYNKCKQLGRFKENKINVNNQGISKRRQ